MGALTRLSQLSTLNLQYSHRKLFPACGGYNIFAFTKIFLIRAIGPSAGTQNDVATLVLIVHCTLYIELNLRPLHEFVADNSGGRCVYYGIQVNIRGKRDCLLELCKEEVNDIFRINGQQLLNE